MGKFKELAMSEFLVITPVEVKDAVLDHFETLDVQIFWKVNKVLVTFEEMEVSIYLTSVSELRDLQGIHLFDLQEDAYELEFRLQGALESCFRDGFTSIFLHLETIEVLK